MKITVGKVLTVLGELAWDYVTGKLEKKYEPKAKGLTHAESELQSRYARMAGPACDKAEVGWRCTRYAGHAGPCAAVRA